MKRIFCAGLAVLFLLLLPGCGRKTAADPETDIDQSNWKTHIFNEAVFPLPDGAELYTTVTPYWDAETGELTYLAKRTAEADTEDGNWFVLEIPVLVTADLRTGEVKSTTELPGSTGESPAKGAIYADEALIVLGAPDRHYRLMRFNREKKKAETSDFINSLFPRQVLGIAGAVRDADGNAAVLSQDELLFVDRTWKAVRSAPLPPEVQGDALLRMRDGTILARCLNREWETCCCLYDAGGGSFGEVISGPGTDAMPCGAGFDYCCGSFANDGTSGIFGRNLAEEEPVFLLNYMNSGIAGNAGLWFAADADTMVFLAHEEQSVSLLHTLPDSKPVLYLRGEDVDLSNARILHLAFANTGLTTGQIKAVTDFNRTHSDCQVVIDDYSEYEDGFNCLSLDVVTGVYKPDILLGYDSSDYIRTAAEKGMTVDLSTFTESDPLVTRDNLFDAAERLFDDGQGGLWGLAPHFTISTTVSTPENLGEYAEGSCWTIFDILDYIERLPEGVDFSEKLTQSAMTALIMKPGSLDEFVDGKSCSFDSPGFLRCLNFIASLPDEDEYRKNSPWAEADNLALTEARLAGRIMTAGGSVYSVTDFARLQLLFGTKDWFPIGDPSAAERRGAGITASARHVFAVMKTCEAPEAAWELCRMFFTDDEGQGGLPSLRTCLRSMAEPYIGREYLWWYERGGKWSLGEGTITEEDRQSPHVGGVFTEEDYEKLTEILDEAGTPLLETQKYADIRGILREEISAFLGGVGTAEDCAAKIQSRASLWLAEHR